MPKPIANPLAIDAPIMSELARPGPLVAANASTSEKPMFADTRSAIEQPRCVDKMIPRRDLGHDPTIFFMRGDLRCDFAGEQIRPESLLLSAQDRDAGFVAGSF